MSTIRDFAAGARAAIAKEVGVCEARYLEANPADVTGRARDQGMRRGLRRASDIIKETLSASVDDTPDLEDENA